MKISNEDIKKIINEKINKSGEMEKCDIVHIIKGRRLEPISFKNLLKEAVDNIDTEEKRNILLIGNSFRDFFKLQLDDNIKTILEMGINLKVLLLDPTSLAAYNRATVEESDRLNRNKEYIETALFEGKKLFF
ncbi:MAG: hypothetical protein ACFFD2_07355 [Promethearchaeota archaeon]